MKLFLTHKKLMKLLMFHVVIINFFFARFGFWFTPLEKCLFCSLWYLCFPKELISSI